MGTDEQDLRRWMTEGRRCRTGYKGLHRAQTTGRVQLIGLV